MSKVRNTQGSSRRTSTKHPNGWADHGDVRDEESTDDSNEDSFRSDRDADKNFETASSESQHEPL